MKTYYYRDGKNLVFEVAIPGVDPKEFPVSHMNFAGNQVLAIGRYQWTVDPTYDVTKATAKYEYGVIKVTVPRLNVSANQILVEGVDQGTSSTVSMSQIQ